VDEPVDPIHYIVRETLLVFKLLGEHEHNVHALMVLYATMDMMAWLDLPQGKDMVQRLDFKAWVDKYMLPTPLLRECTSEDLYGARCAILHTRGATPPNAKKHGQRSIWYYGRPTPEVQDLRLRKAGDPDVILVSVLDLLEAFTAAMFKFHGDVVKDADRRSRLEGRAQQWLRYRHPDTF
jgi:hypothetical protein